MPEGPEIRRAAQALDRALAGQPLRLVLVHPLLKAREPALRGAVVESVRARSKAMLTRFSTGDLLYSHNPLYGEWRITRHDEPLIDQTIVAGLGNSLRSEILFQARLNPWRRLGELDGAERHRLAVAVHLLTRRSFRQGGVCVPPADYRRHRQRGADYEGARFFVSDRAGQACRVCGERIERAAIGGRGIFVCVTCQSVYPLPPVVRA